MSKADERKAKAFLHDAYSLVTESDTLAFYDRWAEDYDAQLERGLHYIAPRELARALSAHHTDHDGALLDVGCGTGLTGWCLKEIGFSTIDGLDFSAAMLSQARQKGIYRNLIEADLNGVLPFDDGAYAAAISTGTFTLGHVGPEPMDELLRALAPGAFFACTVHAGIWESKGFSMKFAALQRAGTIRAVEQRSGCFFEGGEPVAKYCVFQMCDFRKVGMRSSSQ
jgi:predicted TPR repeat methyltransferase